MVMMTAIVMMREVKVSHGNDHNHSSRRIILVMKVMLEVLTCISSVNLVNSLDSFC